jgi:hypothetical protein
MNRLTTCNPKSINKKGFAEGAVMLNERMSAIFVPFLLAFSHVGTLPPYRVFAHQRSK